MKRQAIPMHHTPGWRIPLVSANQLREAAMLRPGPMADPIVDDMSRRQRFPRQALSVAGAQRVVIDDVVRIYTPLFR